jgi:NADH pyrophosphatase NudC (nudix superfamily)
LPDERSGELRDAVVAVVRSDGRYLVIRRGPDVILPGYWAPLSGRVEHRETQEHAVVREVAEEVGLAVRPVGKVWECLTEDGQFRLHWWIVEAGPGELQLDPHEVSAAAWIRAEEFARLEPTFAADAQFFREILPTLPAPPRQLP